MATYNWEVKDLRDYKDLSKHYDAQVFFQGTQNAIHDIQLIILTKFQETNSVVLKDGDTVNLHFHGYSRFTGKISESWTMIGMSINDASSNGVHPILTTIYKPQYINVFNKVLNYINHGDDFTISWTYHDEHGTIDDATLDGVPFENIATSSGITFEGNRAASISIGGEQVHTITIDGQVYTFNKNVVINENIIKAFVLQHTTWTNGIGTIDNTVPYEGLRVTATPNTAITSGDKISVVVHYVTDGSLINGTKQDVTYTDVEITNPAVTVTDDVIKAYVEQNIQWTDDKGILELTKWAVPGTKLTMVDNHSIVSKTDFTVTVEALPGYTVNGQDHYDYVANIDAVVGRKAYHLPFPSDTDYEDLSLGSGSSYDKVLYTPGFAGGEIIRIYDKYINTPNNKDDPFTTSWKRLGECPIQSQYTFYSEETKTLICINHNDIRTSLDGKTWKSLPAWSEYNEITTTYQLSFWLNPDDTTDYIVLAQTAYQLKILKPHGVKKVVTMGYNNDDWRSVNYDTGFEKMVVTADKIYFNFLTNNMKMRELSMPRDLDQVTGHDSFTVEKEIDINSYIGSISSNRHWLPLDWDEDELLFAQHYGGIIAISDLLGAKTMLKVDKMPPYEGTPWTNVDGNVYLSYVNNNNFFITKAKSL